MAAPGSRPPNRPPAAPSPAASTTRSAGSAELPGLGLAVGLAAAGRWGRRAGRGVLGFTGSPVSEITVAVVLGLLIRNAVGLPAVYEPGLRLCGREVLRLGIVLLGLRLSLGAVGQVGLAALPVILAVHRRRPGGGDRAVPRAGPAAAAGQPDRGRDEHLRRQRDRRHGPGHRRRGRRGQLRGRVRHPVRPAGPVRLPVPGPRPVPRRAARPASSSGRRSTTRPRWPGPG